MKKLKSLSSSRRTFIKGASSVLLSVAAGLSLPTVTFAQDKKTVQYTDDCN